MSSKIYEQAWKVNFPEFGGHKWNWPYLDFHIQGTAGGGSITFLTCKQCGYQIRVNFGYKTSQSTLRFRILYIYDEKETCNAFKMNNALS